MRLSFMQDTRSSTSSITDYVSILRQCTSLKECCSSSTSTSSRAFAAADMVGLVEETPLLTELEYHPDEESSPKALLAALTPRVESEDVACLLPRLENLFVYWDTSETVSMVGDLIEKRYALVERGITRLRYLSCKPVQMSIAYDCTASLPLVENLAARLDPFCRCGLLKVDWEAYRYDLEFSYC